MNSNPMTCDPDRIERFLDHQLTADEEDAFEWHLSECKSCREQLESKTATEEIWIGLRESLVGFLQDDLDSQEKLEPSDGLEDVVARQSILEMLAPTDDERMLGRLGPYEVMGIVGSGGMGVVLKALDPSLNRYVAIKVLAPQLCSSGAARRRFSREAQAAAAVVHDNVIEIHGVSDAGGVPYFVMRYVRGPSLQKRLDEHGPLATAEVLRIGMQAARGLAAAHSQGLVHRDVKPANILLADGVERVKLTDFGLARAADDASLTQTGYIAGTPQYMSPEQARGETVDERSDLFSLGSVMYAMCTGRPPFRAENSYGVLRRITDESPRAIRDINPDIPLWLCEVVDRLMAKRAEDRFGSAREVAEVLEQCLAHLQQPATTTLPESLRKTSTGNGVISFFKRKKGILTMATLTMALLGAIAVSVTAPPPIAGNWHGEGWGNVVLEESEPGVYEGSYSETLSDKPGTIELKWSRIERRYNGRWSEGKNRFGKISVRPVGDEVRGALTTSRESGTNPGTPELADLQWERGHAEATQPQVTTTQDKAREYLREKNLFSEGANEIKQKYKDQQRLSEARLVARGFFKAVQEQEMNKAKDFVDQESPAFVKSLANENFESLRQMYARNPNKWTSSYGAGFVEGDWAVMHLGPPDGRGPHTVGIVLHDTPDGWRVYYIDDYDPSRTPISDFLHRHWGSGASKKADGANDAKQDDEDEQQMRDAALVTLSFLTAVKNEELEDAKEFVDSENQAFEKSLTKENLDSLRSLIARHPEGKAKIDTVHAEGKWAATYLVPSSAKDTHTVAFVLRNTSDGWRVYHLDDYDPARNLISDFLHRHWGVDTNKKDNAVPEANQALSEAIEDTLKIVRGHKEKEASAPISDEDLKKLRTCQGINELQVAYLEVGKSRAFCFTTPVKDTRGTVLTLELTFEGKSKDDWKLEVFVVEPVDRIARDIQRFRALAPEAREMKVSGEWYKTH